MAENLASKYRPKTLSDVCEQSVVVDIVRNIVASKTMSNRNFLFIGSQGVGKTTIARALANELNEGKGEPIELDAASHSGVESVREIIDQARQYPVGCNYKVFIIDECFHGDSEVSCLDGYKKISKVDKGDIIFTLSGQAKVLNRFENTVSSTNLILVHLTGRDILTTKDHLFMTKHGWVKASELMEGDAIYAESNQNLRDMRKGVRELCIGQSQSMREGMWRSSTHSKVEVISAELSTNWLHEIVSNLRKEFLHSQERQCINLFEQMCSYIEEAARPFGEATCCYAEAQALIYMPYLWQGNVDSQFRAQEILLDKMSRCLDASTSREKEDRVLECLRNLWREVSSEISWSEDMLQEVCEYADKSLTERQKISSIFNSNESKESNVRSGSSQEGDDNEREKWYIAFATCYTWWKWILYRASDATLSSFRSGVDIRVSCNYACQEERQLESLSIQLQSRPRTTGHSVSSRSGWCRPQYEIAQIARSEEGELFSRIRVESTEVYKPGDNDKSFASYFSDTELRSGYVTMYDLEVEGHPSYFVNDVLVHNCHALSVTAWQSLLKTLEEQPAKSIFMLATTNPEKIPATIISRVQTFQLSKISLQGVFNRLKYIIEEENKEGRNITYTEDALLYLAKSAQGGMRDGITLLDKSLAYSKDITIDNLQNALGLPKYDDYFDLLNAIAKKDNNTIVKIINDVYNSGVNFVRWFEGFFSFVTNIVKFIYLQDINQTMIPSTYQDKISHYGTAHSALCLKLSNKLAKMNQELKTTQYLQELAISYLCTPPAVKKQ